MIKYALACSNDHTFEGWFGSSTDYDDQSARRLVSCPVCGSAEVAKQIMAPSVLGPRDVDSGRQRAFLEAMNQIRSHVEESFDDVGDSFAAEARAIHEGKAEERGIYGQATGAEVMELIKDGVPVSPLPPKPPSKDEIN